MITVANVSRIQIPLPPLPEQEALVAEVEGYQKVIDGVRALAERMEQRVRERVARVWGLGSARPDTPAEDMLANEDRSRSEDQVIGRSDNGMPAAETERTKPLSVMQPSTAKPSAAYVVEDAVLSVAAEPVVQAQQAAKRGRGRPPRSERRDHHPAEEAILEHLRTHPGWHGKNAVLEATGVDAGAWNAAIAALLSAGQVERQGEKKGARYRAA